MAECSSGTFFNKSSRQLTDTEAIGAVGAAASRLFHCHVGHVAKGPGGHDNSFKLILFRSSFLNGRQPRSPITYSHLNFRSLCNFRTAHNLLVKNEPLGGFVGFIWDSFL
jgi:hypothetical protein